jgi:hypothetical protein
MREAAQAEALTVDASHGVAAAADKEGNVQRAELLEQRGAGLFVLVERKGSGKGAKSETAMAAARATPEF